jgi:hypothetical protein
MRPGGWGEIWLQTCGEPVTAVGDFADAAPAYSCDARSASVRNEGAAVHTVIARFHHLDRDLDDLESDLVHAGAEDARITGYTVALTFGSDSRERASEAARRVLDRIGATGIRIHRPAQGPPPRPEAPAAMVDPELTRRDDSQSSDANLMARLEMDVFGHP